MLVLSRRQDEGVVITVGGVRIRVTVLDFRGDKVRLGVSAPPEVAINRDEVQRAIDEAKRAVPASVRARQQGEE